MTQPNQSTVLRVPAPESTNEGRLTYIAALERRVIALSLVNIKFRAALELATGVPYDSTNFDNLSFSDLEETIAHDMSRGLKITLEEARKRIQENKIISNPE